MAQILVIDDDDFVRQLVVDLLEKESYDVISTGSGTEGMNLFYEDPTDLVITDINMPDIEGTQVIQKLSKEYPKTKFIVISGYGRGGAIDYFDSVKSLGIKHVFQKPFDNRDFLNTVKLLIEK